MFEIGSIPACAGEPTLLPTSATYPDMVYPRVCGGTRRMLRVGPPVGLWVYPRVCGGTGGVGVVLKPSGSIPACAGEPGSPKPPPLRVAVYPRVCGGTYMALIGMGLVWGLSPRVRGNLVTRSSNRAKYAEQVYPRVCGGTAFIRAPHSITEGLSPRVRGNPCCLTKRNRRERSIPACAGEP